MKILTSEELSLVFGGDPPSCTTMPVTITGSDGNSATFYITVCSCPEDATTSVTVEDGVTTVECK